MTKSRPLIFSFLVLAVIMLLAAINRPFISDELHEAWTVLQLLKKTPYAEELYYKNVLGYYLKLPLLLIFDSWWSSLILSRIALAVTFLGTIYLLVRSLTKYFDSMPITLGLLLFATFTENVTHGTSYRLDMLTACFGIFSLLTLYNSRFALAGLLAGTSFLVSQKGAYYCVCGFVAIAFTTRDLKSVLRYTLAGVASGAAYVLFWAIFADLPVVLHTIFVKDTMMATKSGYEIHHYWIRSFMANPVFWITSLFSIAYLFEKQKNQFDKINLIYISLLLVLCFLNGQPWPYFFVLLTPFLLINVCDFFDRLLLWNKRPARLLGLALLGAAISSYHLFKENTLTNSYQKYNLMLMENILEKGDTYLAGFNLHKDYQQAHPEFTWLNAINRKLLHEWPDSKKQKLVSELLEKPPKIIIYNYRFDDLDPLIKVPLFENFEHLWANIYIYSLKLSEGTRSIEVKYSGNYVVGSTEVPEIIVNGRTVKIGSRIHLEKGKMDVSAGGKTILKLIPNITDKLIAEYYRPRDLNFTYDF